MVKYWYGLRDGKVVSIQDIPEELKGLACRCICPACGRSLEACSLGANNKRVRHFKHAKEHNPNVIREGSAGGCDVYTANESGLHLLAKQIIQEERRVMIPAFKIYAKDILNDIPADIYRKLPPFVVEDASVLTCAAVELEKYINGFKPDIVMQLPSRVTHELLVEINAGHSVDEEKLRNVKFHGFPMMEIDVRSFRDEAYKKEELRQFLLESCAEREWIYFPLRKDVREKAREFFENIEDVIKYRKDKANREKGKAKITALLDSKTYTAEINRLRSDIVFQQWCSQHSAKFRFIKEAGKVPFYIDIPISGEMIFKCDRRIWQGIIFGRYVYDRTVKEEGSHIPSEDLFAVLRDDYNIPIDYLLTYKQTLEEDSKIREVNLSISVIQQYLEYLEFLGFIEKEDGWWYESTAIQTAIPPASENATFFENLLREVDGNCFEIDALISEKLHARHMDELTKQEAIRQKEQEEAYQRWLVACETQRKEDEEIKRRYQQERLRRMHATQDEVESSKPITGVKSVYPRLATSDLEMENQQEEADQLFLRQSDFTLNMPLYDRNGRRRYLCENCNKILLWSSFSMPEGRKSICLRCKDKIRKEESAKKRSDALALAKEILKAGTTKHN